MKKMKIKIETSDNPYSNSQSSLKQRNSEIYNFN